MDMDERISSVYDKFSNAKWNSMTSSEKLQALQELAAISAEKNHANVQNVEALELEGATYGYFDGDKIVVNKHILEDNRMISYEKDEEGNILETYTYDVQDANLQMMDTIFHEDFHAFQYQAINGEIPQEVLQEMGITQETIHNWEANYSSLNYVDPEIDGNLYRIQGLEKTAFEAGEKNTLEAFSYLNNKHGEDVQYQNYLTNISNDSYEKNLQFAQMRYNDMSITETLQNKMNERYYNENFRYENYVSAQEVGITLDNSMMNGGSNKTVNNAVNSFGGKGEKTGSGIGKGVDPGSGIGKGMDAGSGIGKGTDPGSGIGKGADPGSGTGKGADPGSGHDSGMGME